jgi:hypothetical protein
MATLHVAWIRSSFGGGGEPGQCINDIVSSENVTTSGTTARSGVRPANATHAVVTSVDSNHYVSNAGLTATIAATNSVVIMSGGFHAFAVGSGEKVAAVTF